MAISSVTILGNTFIARILALIIKNNNPLIEVKILTNGEVYNKQIISPIHSLTTGDDLGFLSFFSTQLNVPAQSIFSQTNSTLGLARSYHGITENELILPFNYSEICPDMLHYYSHVKNYKKYEATSESLFYEFIEWLIQKGENLPDVISPFPLELYKNNKNQPLFFNFKLHLQGRVISNKPIWNYMPGCFDLDGIVNLLNEKILEENISINEKVVTNITTELTESIGKNRKDIKTIELENETIETDLVINTGIDNSNFDNFIEANEELTEINECINFSAYSITENEKNFCPVYENFISNNSFIKNLNYTNSTVNILFSDSGENELSKDATKFLVNQNYDSNYIFFDISKLGLNPMLDEEIKTVLVYSNLIGLTVNSSIIDPLNLYNYIQNLQTRYNDWRHELKTYNYYLLNNISKEKYAIFNNIPQQFKTNFQNKIPVKNKRLTDETIGMNAWFSISQKLASQGVPERTPVSLYDYIFTAAQKGKITSFVYPYNENENMFKDVLYVGKELTKRQLYFLGFLTFDDYKNIVILDNPGYDGSDSFVLDDGTEIESKTETVKIKIYKKVGHDDFF